MSLSAECHDHENNRSLGSSDSSARRPRSELLCQVVERDQENYFVDSYSKFDL